MNKVKRISVYSSDDQLEANRLAALLKAKGIEFFIQGIGLK